MPFSQQTSGYSLLSQTIFAVLSTNSIKGAARHNRRREAQKAQKGAARRSKGANGTDVNIPSVITLGAKEVLEGGHQGRNSKIAERKKLSFIYLRKRNCSYLVVYLHKLRFAEMRRFELGRSEVLSRS